MSIKQKHRIKCTLTTLFDQVYHTGFSGVSQFLWVGGTPVYKLFVKG